MNSAFVFLVLAVVALGESSVRVRNVVPTFKADVVNPDYSFSDASPIPKPGRSLSFWFSLFFLRFPIFHNYFFFSFLGVWNVLLFFPADFTFVCPTEILAFSDAAEKFKERNVQLYFISVDTKHTHLAWMRTPRKDGGLGRIKIPLVSDVTKEISQAYDLLVEDGGDKGLALRGSFIIDPKGVLHHMSVNNLRVGRNVEETLRLIDGFQVCKVISFVSFCFCVLNIRLLYIVRRNTS